MITTDVTNRYLRNAKLWLEGPAAAAASPSRSSNGDHRTPYLGPQEYETADRWRFFGRQREQTHLLQLLTAERVVLLYSPSGAGKTSLIKAALIPDLIESEELNVLPVMRVGREPDAFQQTLPAEVADLSFAEFLDRREAAFGNDNPTVLIFDQFEEFLTTDPTDDAGRREFLAQVGEALRNRNRCALFAMREEYEPRLDPYRRYIPNRWSVKLRLDLLTTEAALTAIQRPAALCSVEFTDEAARKLVDDLSEIQVSNDDSLVKSTGQYVEPVQLQVACLSVWNGREPGATRIDEESISLAGGVSHALTDYYDQSVANVARDTRVSERDIRRWADRELITPLGVRGQVLKEPNASRGLDNRAIWGLVNEYIVRKEERRGAIWFELAHDRLIEPVRTSNARWFQEHLNLLQRQAELWDERKRPKDLLLRGAALKEAKRWHKERPDELTPSEGALLDQSRRVEKRNWISGLLVAGTLVGLILLAWWILDVQRDRTQSANEALASERIMNALLLGDHRLDFALLLGGVSTSLTESPATNGGLMEVLSESPISGFLRGHTEPVQNIVVSPDGRTLASSDSSGAILLWDAETLQGLGTKLQGQETVAMLDLAFSPDGALLAGADAGGAVWVWNVVNGVVTGEPLRYADSRGVAQHAISVAFDPAMGGARRLAVGYERETIAVWNVDDRTILYELRINQRADDDDTGAVIDLAYTPEGDFLISAGRNGRVIRWNLYDSNADRSGIVNVDSRGLTAFAMSHDGTSIATANDDGTVMLWDVRSGMEREAPLLLNTGIQELAFSQDGTDLIMCGSERGLMRWDLIGDRFQPAPTGYALTSCSAAFLENNGRTLLLTGSADGSIVAWTEASPPSVSAGVLAGSPTRLAVSIAFTEESDTLVLASMDGMLERWTIDASAWAATWQTAVALQDYPTPGTAGEVFVAAMVLDRNGARVAASFCTLTKGNCREPRIAIWDARTGALIVSWTATTRTPPSILVFSPDGSRLASGSDDGIITIWDTARPTATPSIVGEHRLSAPDGPQTPGTPGLQLVQSLAFSRDATILAIGGASGEITFWDINADQAQRYAEHGGGVLALAFSDDGARLSSGGQDGKVVTWSVNGQIDAVSVESSVAHGSPVTALAFTSDGRMLASAASDWSIILWDRETGLAITSQSAQHNESSTALVGLAFSPDGNRLAASGGAIGARNRDAASVTIWDASAASLTAKACQIAGRNLEKHEWDPNFPGQPYEQICLDGVLNDAFGHLMDRNTDEARSSFALAADLSAGSAEQSNMTCLLGAIEGFADTVMPACNHAVELETDNGHYHDSRAIARAVLGDLSGAAADLTLAIDWMSGVGVEQSIVELRLDWLARLEAGENPLANVASDLKLHRQALALASATWTTFASPSHPYSVSWDGDWRLGRLSSVDGADTLSLLGSGAAVIVTASTFITGESCQTGVLGTLNALLREDVKRFSEAPPRLVAPAWPAGAAGQLTLLSPEGGRRASDLVVALGCRELSQSTMMRVVAIMSVKAYDEQLPVIEELIANIRITGSDLLGGVPGPIATLDEIIDSIFQGPRPDGSILTESLSPSPLASPQVVPAATPGASPQATPAGASAGATPIAEDPP